MALAGTLTWTPSIVPVSPPFTARDLPLTSRSLSDFLLRLRFPAFLVPAGVFFAFVIVPSFLSSSVIGSRPYNEMVKRPDGSASILWGQTRLRWGSDLHE